MNFYLETAYSIGIQVLGWYFLLGLLTFVAMLFYYWKTRNDTTGDMDGINVVFIFGFSIFWPFLWLAGIMYGLQKLFGKRLWGKK